MKSDFEVLAEHGYSATMEEYTTLRMMVEKMYKEHSIDGKPSFEVVWDRMITGLIQTDGLEQYAWISDLQRAYCETEKSVCCISDLDNLAKVDDVREFMHLALDVISHENGNTETRTMNVNGKIYLAVVERQPEELAMFVERVYNVIFFPYIEHRTPQTT